MPSREGNMSAQGFMPEDDVDCGGPVEKVEREGAVARCLRAQLAISIQLAGRRMSREPSKSIMARSRSCWESGSSSFSCSG